MGTSTVRPDRADSSIRRTITKAERVVLQDYAMRKIQGDDPLGPPDDERYAAARTAIALLDQLGWAETAQREFTLTVPDAQLERFLTEALAYIDEVSRDDVAGLDQAADMVAWAYDAMEARAEPWPVVRELADAKQRERRDDARCRLRTVLAERAVVVSLLGRDDEPPPVIVEAEMHDAIAELRDCWATIGTSISDALRSEGASLDDLETAINQVQDLYDRAMAAAISAVRLVRGEASTTPAREGA